MRPEFRDLALDDERLAELAVAVRANAGDMIADARFMLDARRFARAHALAVLGLEEVGKVGLCLGALFGTFTLKQVLESWDRHVDKLTQSHLLAFLYAPSYPVTSNVVERLDAAIRSDAALRLRGLYVDPTRNGTAGPGDISAAQATDIVVLAEEIRVVLQEMDLAGAPGRFSTADAEMGREVMRDVEAVLAATREELEALPESERPAAEMRLRAACDELVAAVRSSLANQHTDD